MFDVVLFPPWLGDVRGAGDSTHQGRGADVVLSSSRCIGVRLCDHFYVLVSLRIDGLFIVGLTLIYILGAGRKRVFILAWFKSFAAFGVHLFEYWIFSLR